MFASLVEGMGAFESNEDRVGEEVLGDYFFISSGKFLICRLVDMPSLRGGT